MRRHLRTPASSTPVAVSAHSGATLVEVLMSLLIMSIGITSVFYLFPIALLSSIKANQLTNTRILADQATAVVYAQPKLILGANEWKPVASYVTNDIVTPRIQAGSNVPETRYYYRALNSGTTSAVEPTWTTADVTDGNVTWSPISLPNVVPEIGKYVPFRYVVDPYGYANALIPTLRQSFGHVNDALPEQATGLPFQCRVMRTNSGLSVNMADRLNFSLPDTWNVLDTTFPVGTPTYGAGSTVITLPPTIPVQSIPVDSTAQISRVVALSPDGRTSASGTITAFDTVNNTVTVNSALLEQVGIGQVRIEVFTRRYTWLAAVHRDESGFLNCQYAVAFNRRFSSDDEKLHDCTIMNTDRTEIHVPAAVTAREGSYAFDALSVRWHRIVSRSGTTIVISPALETVHGTAQTRMMFLPGIVKVFPLDQ
ncbi:type IV pilus modification PilV family protein [Planctomicrobium sp. SH527]|uniref:type IV pilus modification PilV family protein n=1 Tax=Planctomicrobium sp. SH527 TaxID=3448123 RepID=UPI003F5B77EC